MAQSTVIGSAAVADEGPASGNGSSTSRQNRKKSSALSKKSRQAKLSASSGAEKLSDDRRKKGGSVMWTILLAGLLFSLVDVVYMLWLVERHEVETRNHVSSHENKLSASIAREGISEDPILNLIRRAGIDPEKLDDESKEALPSWEDIVNLYGPKPIVHGIDQCNRFQEKTNKLGFVGTAGEFDSKLHNEFSTSSYHT